MAPGSPEAASSDGRYVATRAAREAVRSQETRVLAALGIDWQQGRPHIRCPYPAHEDANPSWRWDEAKARAYCSCIARSHSIFDVVMASEGGDFEAAKLRVAALIGRGDIIRSTTRTAPSFQATDAESLLNAPQDNRDDSLPCRYLAFRLGIAPDEAPLPATAAVGLKSLAYYDPPRSPKGKPRLVGHWPCAVFATVDAEGKSHAHRIYLSPEGQGKADLPPRKDGHPRDAKKSAKIAGKRGETTAGRVVVFGDIGTATHAILAEGIETAAALAHAFRQEIEAHGLAIAAAISASGLEAFRPWGKTQRVTVAGDRDEGEKIDGRAATRRGEAAARAFALRHHECVEVRIALPGEPGESVDWLDILHRDGCAAVRAGIDGAERFAPSEAETAEAVEQAARQAELAEIAASYPLPLMDGLQLDYQHTRLGRVRVHRFAGLKTDEATGENKEVWIPVASPFGVSARLRHADQADAYGLRVHVQDMAGQRRAVDIERADLVRAAGTDFRAPLYAAGLRVEPEGEGPLMAALKAAEPAAEIVMVARPGWHRLAGSADPVFMAPSGHAAGLAAGCTLELAGAQERSVSATVGELSGWRRAVEAATRAERCPHWVIGVCAGFAGPLIGLTGLDTMGVNLSGESSAGKTTAQKLAVSPWASPKVGAGLLHPMKTTENAMESLAQGSTGTVLALDEMSHADGRAVARMIYSIAGGVGKARMGQHATLRHRYAWSTFAVLSGECSLEEKVRADGGQWLAGMAVRIADIDVTEVNRAVDQATLDAIAGIEGHYGHAGPAFVTRLVDEGLHRTPDVLRERVLKAARAVAGANADSAQVRAATAFAVLVVAGELAKSFGILPADTPVRPAVEWAWGRFATSSDAAALRPDERAVGNIRAWIAERWDVTIKSVDAATGVNNREAVAWYDETTVYIPKERIREAAGNTLKAAHIGAVLDRKGLLAGKPEPDRYYGRWVPRVGRVDTYALRRSEFGRSDLVSDPQGFSVYAGGGHE